MRVPLINSVEIVLKMQNILIYRFSNSVLFVCLFVLQIASTSQFKKRLHISRHIFVIAYDKLREVFHDKTIFLESFELSAILTVSYINAIAGIKFMNVIHFHIAFAIKQFIQLDTYFFYLFF